jgi:hypothetical protein
MLIAFLAEIYEVMGFLWQIMLVNIMMIMYWEMMLYTQRKLLPLSSACNVSVEAAVFCEMFMVTRMYGVNDMW